MATPLPPLREDLHLAPGPNLEQGAPTWTLHDPVRNRFFRIGRQEFECLARWSLGDPEQVAAAINRETSFKITQEKVEAFRHFLTFNSLLTPADAEVLNLLRQRTLKAPPGIWTVLLHHYLFFRIPLMRPDRFLTATLFLVRPFFSALFFKFILGAGLLSGYLLTRQWETFVHTFLHFFTWEGMFWYGLALTLVKVIHELGHAYTAKYYGLRIPTMGLAFLVLWPVLYTDVSEVWKLPQRRPRLRVAAAGIMTELAIAILASLAWSFVPDGGVRSALFFIATITWISTLTINLSPFMRFDGYYILSDYLDIPNLQERAFAMGRWQMRGILLGIDRPPPETFSPRTRRILLAYTWFTWIYRLVLFTTIAFMVYHMFFKVLGIFLFLVEVGWFVLRPILGEWMAWWQQRAEIRWNRNNATFAGLLGLSLLLAVIPWRGEVVLPAVLKAEKESKIYPPFPAQIAWASLREGQTVAAGERLLQLATPDLTYNLETTRLEMVMQEEDLKRSMSRKSLIDRQRITQSLLSKAMSNHQGYLTRAAQLAVTAPHAGTILEVGNGVKPGLWVRDNTLLAILVDPASAILIGFLAEEEMARIQPGARGHFIPDLPEWPILPCTVKEVNPTAPRTLEEPYLASIHGGDLPVQTGTRNELVLHSTVYRVTLIPDPDHPPVTRILRGRVILAGEPRSFLQWAWLKSLGVLIRESGF